MAFSWLFVVQNFEIKSYQDSAAKTEVVEPILASKFVSQHKVMCFDRTYKDYYINIVKSSLSNIYQNIQRRPVVIYGGGLHTEQHLDLLSRFNIVAVADRDSKLWGTTLSGYPIISSSKILQYSQDVIISSKAYEDAIWHELSTDYPELSLHKLYHLQENNEEFNQQMSQEVLTELSNNRPDILFYCPTHPADCLSVQYWIQIKQRFPDVKFITLWWDYDVENEHSPYLQFERDCLLWNDICIENSNATRLEEMIKGKKPYQLHTNIEKIIFHPTIFDPALFYMEKQVEKQYDIALFGSAAGERKQWISFLNAEYPVNFHHIGGVLHGESTLSIEKYASALRRTKICINTQTYSAREQCKGKVREALACGVVLLEQDNQQTKALLKEGEGVLYFSSKIELKEKLTWLLNTPGKIEEIVEKGQQVWQKRMHCQQWTKTLLENVNLQ